MECQQETEDQPYESHAAPECSKNCRAPVVRPRRRGAFGLILNLLLPGLLRLDTAAAEPLRWSVTPYLWATDTTVDLTADGTPIGGGKVTFSDLLIHSRTERNPAIMNIRLPGILLFALSALLLFSGCKSESDPGIGHANLTPEEAKAIAKEAYIFGFAFVANYRVFIAPLVDPRLAEGKRAEFNVSFTDEKVSYAIALRNGVIAITEQPNKGPKLKLTKDDWSQLITGEKRFANLHASLKAFDEAIGR